MRDGSGYCQTHQEDKTLGRFADKRRGSRHERGYGSRWVKQRERILRRDCGLCQPCKREGHTTVATEIDHIKPKAEGGSDADSNLQSICHDCHQAKTIVDAKRGRGIESLQPNPPGTVA